MQLRHKLRKSLSIMLALCMLFTDALPAMAEESGAGGQSVELTSSVETEETVSDGSLLGEEGVQSDELDHYDAYVDRTGHGATVADAIELNWSANVGGVTQVELREIPFTAENPVKKSVKINSKKTKKRYLSFPSDTALNGAWFKITTPGRYRINAQEFFTDDFIDKSGNVTGHGELRCMPWILDYGTDPNTFTETMDEPQEVTVTAGQPYYFYVKRRCYQAPEETGRNPRITVELQRMTSQTCSDTLTPNTTVSCPFVPERDTYYYDTEIPVHIDRDGTYYFELDILERGWNIPSRDMWFCDSDGTELFRLKRGRSKLYSLETGNYKIKISTEANCYNNLDDPNLLHTYKISLRVPETVYVNTTIERSRDYSDLKHVRYTATAPEIIVLSSFNCPYTYVELYHGDTTESFSFRNNDPYMLYLPEAGEYGMTIYGYGGAWYDYTYYISGAPTVESLSIGDYLSEVNMDYGYMGINTMSANNPWIIKNVPPKTTLSGNNTPASPTPSSPATLSFSNPVSYYYVLSSNRPEVNKTDDGGNPVKFSPGQVITADDVDNKLLIYPWINAVYTGITTWMRSLSVPGSIAKLLGVERTFTTANGGQVRSDTNGNIPVGSYKLNYSLPNNQSVSLPVNVVDMKTGYTRDKAIEIPYEEMWASLQGVTKNVHDDIESMQGYWLCTRQAGLYRVATQGYSTILVYGTGNSVIAKKTRTAIINVTTNAPYYVYVIPHGTTKLLTRPEERTPLERISFGSSTGILQLRTTYQLEPVLYPEAANVGIDLTWTSSNPSVATVDENGLLSTVSRGTTTITVRSENGLTATCTIEVKPNHYEVSFDLNGHGYQDQYMEEQFVRPGNRFWQPEMPKDKNGYIFKGWYTEPQCINRWDFDDYPDDDMTLYAKWERAESGKYYFGYTNGITGTLDNTGTILTLTGEDEVTYRYFNFEERYAWDIDDDEDEDWDYYFFSTFVCMLVNRIPSSVEKVVFDDCKIIGSINYLFAKTSVTSIDFSGLDASNINSLWKMFDSCYNLAVIKMPTIGFEGWKGSTLPGQFYDSTGNTYNELTPGAIGKVLAKNMNYFNSTVTFDLNGHGNAQYSEQVIKSGEKVNKVEKPVETGYLFRGWYTEPACRNLWNFNNDTAKNDMTLYAKWEPLNDNLIHMGCTNSITGEYDETTKTLTLSGTDDMDGVCWYWDEVYQRWGIRQLNLISGAVYQNINLEVENIKFNKCKIENSASYMFSRMANVLTCDLTGLDTSALTDVSQMFSECYGLSVLKTPTSLPANVNIELPDELFDSQGNPHSTLNSRNTNRTLVEQSKVDLLKYSVVFDANEGTGSMDPQSVLFEVSTPLNPNTFTRTGYDFLGWNTAADGKGRTYADKASVKDLVTEFNGSITLYAQWGKPHGIKYMDSDTEITGLSPAKYYEGRVTSLPSARKEGYDFAGWYADKDLSGEKIESISAESKTDLVFYAKWTAKIPEYTVTFNTDGGSAVSSQTVAEGKKATKPATNPTKSGYTFAGWFTSDTFAAAFDFDAEITANTTVYAKWNEIPKFKVTFNVDGGSAVAEQTIEEGRKATKPAADPAREGFKFEGWYTSATFETAFDFDAAITADATVYAKWSQIIKNFTVTFSTAGGSAIAAQTVEEGKTATKPETNPTREGYRFGGWYADAAFNKTFDFTAAINADTTVYAKWYARGMSVDKIADQVYTGSAIKPEIRVYDGDMQLREKTDYTLSFKNNTKVGVATVTITGKGEYTGTATENFNIVAIPFNDDDFTVSIPWYTYTGSSITPKATVRYGTKVLKEGTDYTVAAGNFVNEGTYTATIEGAGNYSGTLKGSFGIAGVNITLMTDRKITVAPIKSIAYTGNEITPEVTVKNGKTVLKEGDNYTLSYRDNTDAGKATVIITGAGTEYAGVREVQFTITGTPISSGKVEDTVKMTYTGDPVEQANYTVKVKGTELREEQDYTVSYLNNVNVGKATMVFTGKGGYTGTLKKVFNIEAYDIKANATGDFRVEMDASYPYEKGGVKPDPVVTFGGETLREKLDYTLSYSSNTKAGGTGKVTITGKGNFKGKYVQEFAIEKQDIDEVTAVAADIKWAGGKGKFISKPVLMDSNGKKLSAGTDYKVKYYITENGEEVEKTSKDKINKPAADLTVTVKITGNGQYDGETSVTYLVKAGTTKKLKSISVKAKDYEGVPVTLTADDFKTTMTLGTDFEIVEGSYSNNGKKGTASVIIRGIGDYVGQKTLKFTIKARKVK